MSEASPIVPSPSPTAGNDPATDPTTPPATEPEGDTFPRTYVEGLRAESATHRTAARDATSRAETLAQTLATALASATGRLADPTDLPFSEALLTDGVPDPALIAAAIDDLLAAKPHLGDRRPVGSVGQGARATVAEPVGLGALLRAGAG